MFFKPQRFEGSSTDRGGSIVRTQQSRFHLRTREEPSLETLWLKKKRAMDEVQKTDPSSQNKFQNIDRRKQQFKKSRLRIKIDYIYKPETGNDIGLLNYGIFRTFNNILYGSAKPEGALQLLVLLFLTRDCPVSNIGYHQDFVVFLRLSGKHCDGILK
jgi:hypothetical protein